MYRKAMMGGTFDRLHEAHRSLLRTAANIADEVFVGIVGDELGKTLFAKKDNNHLIQSYKERATGVSDFLSQFDVRFEVGELLDPWGPAPHDPDAEVIVVSYETEPSAHRINAMREEADLNILDIVVIPWIYVDGEPISSTRLRSQEIAGDRTL